MYYDKLIIFFLFISGLFLIIMGSTLENTTSQIVMMIGFFVAILSIAAGILVSTNKNNDVFNHPVDPHDLDEITLCEF